jgi:hypothetical protein
MTPIDDSVRAAGVYMKAAEDVLAAFRSLSLENRTRLQTWFPTLTTNLQLLGNAHKVFE